jgi:hypothetical protein
MNLTPRSSFEKNRLLFPFSVTSPKKLFQKCESSVLICWKLTDVDDNTGHMTQLGGRFEADNTTMVLQSRRQFNEECALVELHGGQCCERYRQN